MNTQTLIRWSGLALVLGGICIAIFVLIHPQGAFTADVIASKIAETAHTFHFLGATFAIFGFIGLLLHQMEKGGRLGLIGVILAFFGTIWFSGLGLMSFAALPFIARNDPALVAPNGLFWSEPPNPVFLLGLLSFVLGYVILGIAILRGVGLPRWSGLLLIVGGLLTSVPPTVVPTVLILTAGGVLLGAGLAWLGYALWSQSVTMDPLPKRTK